MKFNFKKISAIATSVLMTGMTVGTAMAAGIAPSDLGGQGNFAIVYGATANSMDQAQATAIDTALRNQFSTSTSVVVGDVALTEEEVVLNGQIDATGSKILSIIQDNKLSNLFDEAISWDDGDGDQNYDFHEEIRIGDMKVVTNLEDDDFEGIALTNYKEQLSYHLVFEDTLNISRLGDSEADSFYLTILGQEYEIVSAATNKITVTTSSEVSLGSGDSHTLSNGKSVKVGSVFSTSVEVLVDGTSKIINEDSSAKVNGVRVSVEAIGYNSNSPETSKVVLKIGEDALNKEYTDGEEFIGQDEDDPVWVWDIDNFGAIGGYVGVTYNQRANRAKDSNIQYVGGGYSFPNNYAAVTFDSVTEREYQELNFFFETEDVYNNSDSSTALSSDVKLIAIEGEEDDTITVGSVETSKMYISAGNANQINISTLDVSEEYAPSNKIRYTTSVAYNTTMADLATIEFGETTLSIGLADVTNESTANLTVTNDVTGEEVMRIAIDFSDLSKIGDTEEEAEAGDVYFSSEDVSTKEYEYMDAYGIIISKGTNVESQVESDEITLSVPEDQVFAKVSVSMGATTSSTGSAGNMIFRDTEASSYAGKNLVIVGGSCVNAAAAKALGVPSDRGVPGCYADSGLSENQFLISKKTIDGGKFAIIVAGYEADQTKSAADYLINRGFAEGVYSSITSETIA